MHHSLLISLLFLLCFMGNFANCIVCTPDSCAAVQCKSVENCDGPNQIIKTGGFCKCCNLCYTILGENESCNSHAHILLGASPPTTECGNGLICHEGKCKSFKALES